MNKNYFFIVISLILFSFQSIFSQNAIWYVSQNGTGNGTSWTTSSNNLQTIMNNALPGDQVWVKQGTYQRAVGLSFSLKEGIAVYGGFPSTINPTINERNPRLYETILQGNQNRVVEAYGTIEPLSPSTILDGFTIKEGSQQGGAGMHLNNCDATFRNLKITNNTSNIGLGAGMSLSNSNATFIQVLVVENTSILTPGYDGDTGGIYINLGAPKFYNCVIVNNHAEGRVGGITISHTDCYFYNCIIYGNTSDYVSPVIYVNSNFDAGSNGVAHSSNSILQDCKGSDYLYDAVQFTLYGYDMGGNFDVDPMFNADYSMQNPIGINKGNTQAYLAVTNNADKDYFNNSRIVDAIDIGLSEYQTVQSEILYVKQNATGDGSSWANASGDLQLMMNNQFKGKSVWVAEGTYYAPEPYFRLRDSVKLYGGFPATGNPTFADRNITLHPTVLTSTYSAVIYNSYPPDKKISAETLVDGFTITKNANSLPYMYGIFENNSDVVYANMTFTDLNYSAVEIRFNSHNTFTDCIFYNNYALVNTVANITLYGGAKASFLRCNFTNNYAFESSGMQLLQNSYAWIDDCLFTNNSTPNVGINVIIILHSGATITNSVFDSNGNSDYAGGIIGISGVENTNPNLTDYPVNIIIDRCVFKNNLAKAIAFQGKSADQLTLSNSLFYKNTSGVGAAFTKVWAGDFYITNCTFTKNHADNQWGGAIFISEATGIGEIRNSIIYNNTSVYSYAPELWTFSPISFKNNLIATSGGSANWDAGMFNNFDIADKSTDLGGNIDGNPLFVDAANDDYRLAAGSPALNVGANALYNVGMTPNLSAFTTDLEGNARIQDTSVDMGAYEFEPFLSTNPFELSSPISVYPNPTEGLVHVLSVDAAVKEIKIYSILGKELMVVKDTKINTAALAEGVYIVKVTLSTNKMYSSKLIKK